MNGMLRHLGDSSRGHRRPFRGAVAEQEMTHLSLVGEEPVVGEFGQSPHALPDEGRAWKRRISRWAWANEMTTDRAGRLLAGFSVAAALLLIVAHSAWWGLACGGIAFNLIQSSLTNRCMVKDALIAAGLPTEREFGIGCAHASMRRI